MSDLENDIKILKNRMSLLEDWVGSLQVEWKAFKVRATHVTVVTESNSHQIKEGDVIIPHNPDHPKPGVYLEEPDYDALVRDTFKRSYDETYFWFGPGTIGEFLTRAPTYEQAKKWLGLNWVRAISKDFYGDRKAEKHWNRPFTKADYERLKNV